MAVPGKSCTVFQWLIQKISKGGGGGSKSQIFPNRVEEGGLCRMWCVKCLLLLESSWSQLSGYDIFHLLLCISMGHHPGPGGTIGTARSVLELNGLALVRTNSMCTEAWKWHFAGNSIRNYIRNLRSLTSAVISYVILYKVTFRSNFRDNLVQNFIRNYLWSDLWSYWAHLCILHGGLLCVAFCLSVCLSLDINSYLKKYYS